MKLRQPCLSYSSRAHPLSWIRSTENKVLILRLIEIRRDRADGDIPFNKPPGLCAHHRSIEIIFSIEKP
jgi:hypothetical protein